MTIYIQKKKAKCGYPIAKVNKVIKKGDIVEFDNPIIVDEEYLRDYINENQEESYYWSFWLQLELSDGKINEYTIGIHNWKESENYNKYRTTGNITFSDKEGEEGEIVLQRDNFFTNLITGFKWNIDKTATISRIASDTALRYTTMRFMYSAEINRLKGIISDSGQIERTINFNEKWTTLPQLIDYSRSLIVQNTNIINQVELEFDENPEIKIGDIIEIDEPSFFTKGRFAVKDINYTYCNDLDQTWKVTVKSADLISTYIDMFRPQEQQTPAKTIDSVVLSEFVEEKVMEVHELEIKADITEHTLNFNL